MQEGIMKVKNLFIEEAADRAGTLAFVNRLS